MADKTKKKVNNSIDSIDNNINQQQDQNQQQDEEPKLKKRRKQPWQAIPTSSHYHVSLMHRDIVTHAVSSEKHGYVVTASQDGVVKFWKRMTIDPIHNKEDNDDNDKVRSAPRLESPRYLRVLNS
ncbi:peptidyl-prolyl cis-trans isomerase [Fragilaria crotonensis]|nr:peptidyl-prolyl cis-trans isomerase [Fragilaria crotonensis]